MALPLPYGVGVVDPACPIDWSHPVNRGLVADWSIVPNSGWRRGPMLRDLVRGGRNPNDGTLTNSPAWQDGYGSNRPGGYGSIGYGGTAYVGASGPSVTGQITVAAWVYFTSSNAFQAIVNKGATSDWASSNYTLATSGSSFRFKGTFGSLDAGSWATGSWIHVAATFDTSANINIYRNGILAGSTAGSSMSAAAGGHRLGNDDGADPFGGYLDSVQVYNRALGPAEVLSLYKETKAGNPNRWRWLLKGAWFPSEQAAGGGGGFQTAWARNRNTLIQPLVTA